MRKKFIPIKAISVILVLILIFLSCIVVFANNELNVESCAIETTDDGIQPDATILITFSDDVNDSSVKRENQSKVSVLDSNGNVYSTSIKTGYDKNGRKNNNSFALNPSTNYKAGESYKVVIYKGVIGKTGATLMNTKAYSFTIPNEKNVSNSSGANTTSTKSPIDTERNLCEIKVLTDGDGNVTDSLTVLNGESVKITAIPEKNSTFIGWYENDELISTEKELSFVAESSRTIVARFKNISKRSIIEKFTENINKGVIIFFSILIILLILPVAILL